MPNPIQHPIPVSCHFLQRCIKHLYSNHLEQVELQLQRTPGTLPRMVINPAIKNLFDFTYDDFELQNYEPQAHIAAPVAV